MSVRVTTVDLTGTDIRFHNGFAWFLDGVFEPYEAAPGLLFTQGVAPNADDPGDLNPTQALAFARLIDSLSDDELETRMWHVMNGRDAGPGDSPMAAAIATVREIATLAHRSVDHGGLRVT